MVFSLAGCGRADETGGIPASTGGKDIEKGYSADHVFSLNSNSNFSFNPSVATNHSNQLICSLVYEKHRRRNHAGYGKRADSSVL